MITYQLRIPQPHTHYAEVEATFPAAGRDTIELMLPVWTPGSYLLREYARHLDSFHAASGWRKISKNRWRIPTLGRDTVTVAYRVYGHELSVRTNWIEHQFALIVPAATFLTLPDLLHEPHIVDLALPPHWRGAWTGLPEIAPHTFRAENFDQLIDCPFYLGSPAVQEFQVEGKQHLLVNEGESGSWLGPAAAEAAECTHRIVEQYQRMMGGLPYHRYVFINLIVESGGGLEHANSTVLMTSRWAWGNTDTPKPDPREKAKPSRHSWLDLVSHEFFHTWNVKRLRPLELGPFDYENENYTTSLWFAEGVTTYYGPLMVRRAGLISDEALLADLSRTISLVQTTPGRLLQPLSASSFDTWIKLYRPHENSANVNISYYTKGCLVAWLLDVRLRRATGNQRSLDSLMRLAYGRFPNGYAPVQIFALCDEVAGRPVNARALVEEAGELDYSEALEWFGLRFAPAPEAKPWLGVITKNDQGRLLIESVITNSPAAQAGLNAGDELLAVDRFRPGSDSLEQILGAVREPETSVLIARRGRVLELSVSLSPEPRRIWQLEPDPQATELQRTRYASWLQSL